MHGRGLCDDRRGAADCDAGAGISVRGRCGSGDRTRRAFDRQVQARHLVAIRPARQLIVSSVATKLFW